MLKGTRRLNGLSNQFGLHRCVSNSHTRGCHGFRRREDQFHFYRRGYNFTRDNRVRHQKLKRAKKLQKEKKEEEKKKGRKGTFK